MYVVDFAFSEPQFSDVTIEGSVERDEVEELAMKQIKMLYPEAYDIEITGVREVENVENA